jgi:hypothetical protein
MKFSASRKIGFSLLIVFSLIGNAYAVLPYPPKLNGDSSDAKSLDLYLNQVSGLETAWSDYSDKSTIVGWSSFTKKQIYYKKIGETVFVNFYLSGTSDSNTVSFTLPYVSGQPTLYLPILATDNSNTDIGMITLVAGGSSVTAIVRVAGGSWTASGTKQIIGQFFYQVQ